jgi:2-dehydropantoate 2-reductase
MRFLVFGAGAIGTYVGGSLALQDNPVVFLERPDVGAELRQRGLRLELDGQERRIENLQVAISLDEAFSIGPFDAAVFALKSYDTQAALQTLAIYKERMPPILCLQNGVENEILLAEALGSDKVIAGTVTSSIGRRAVGDIVLERSRGIGVAGGQPLSARLVAALDAAGLHARLYPDAAAMKWSKLLTNLLANASTAILDMAPLEVFSHPGLYRLEITQLREALAVMDAQGIKVVDLPGTPVRALAWAARSLPLPLSRPILQRGVGGGRGRKMPSLHIDLHNRRGKSEVETLNGAVVRYGERFGISTPVNRLFNETLLALTEGKLPLGAYTRQPEKLIQFT